MRFVRIMDGLKSNANGYQFVIDDVNVSPVWNPSANNAEEYGGFNFTNEENVLRWMIRGNVVYDVIIPEDADVRKINNKNTPDGVWRTNKIIVKNPKIITDDMCIEFYKISNVPEKTYFQILAIMAGKGFENICEKIIQDKVNENNIQECINECLQFSFYKENGIYDKILEKLHDMKTTC